MRYQFTSPRLQWPIMMSLGLYPGWIEQEPDIFSSSWHQTFLSPTISLKPEQDDKPICDGKDISRGGPSSALTDNPQQEIVSLRRPLSELTEELIDVPIKDIEAWVNRYFEVNPVRRGAADSIKRPSNSFILYRSAYTITCRILAQSGRHQEISSIAGASWAMESIDVKNRFKAWAKTESENHQKVFPDYKFRPRASAAGENKCKRTLDKTSRGAIARKTSRRNVKRGSTVINRERKS